MILMLARFLFTVGAAFLAGRLVSKLKLPAILGWLITGMVLGPHAFSVMDQSILDAGWYQTLVHLLECSVGLMIGTELVWKKIKSSGKAIIITTLTQSLGTFLVVSLVFCAVFSFAGIPLYLAFIFGGIALATAPAPALSIVREFKTNGPVTQALIPMAALDDIVGCVVFFVTIAVVAGHLSTGSLPLSMILLVVLLPLVIGGVVGLLGGAVLKKERSKPQTLALLMGLIALAALGGFFFNRFVLPSPVLNFMLIGMAFAAVFSNMIPETRLDQIMEAFNPFLGGAMIVVILNLGAPLDYHLILGAGLFTAIYILARAAGKYFGAYFGASITHSPETVKKYLGLTLLPHSGVSLVFTGIAVSVLSGPAPDCAQIIQGTIAAAAVINEVLAVIAAKKGFEWAHELDHSGEGAAAPGEHTVITISRQYGSGGREIGRAVAARLGIPFYDREIIELAAQNSTLPSRHFEDSETQAAGGLLDELSSNVHRDLPLADKVFLQQAAVIQDLAQKGSCVVVGRCADSILKNRQKLLRVYVYADLEARTKRVLETYHGTADDLEKLEKNRCSYYQHYTGSRFGDAGNYDLCLNSGTLGAGECVKAICSAYRAGAEPL